MTTTDRPSDHPVTEQELLHLSRALHCNLYPSCDCYLIETCGHLVAEVFAQLRAATERAERAEAVASKWRVLACDTSRRAAPHSAIVNERDRAELAEARERRARELLERAVVVVERLVDGARLRSQADQAVAPAIHAYLSENAAPAKLLPDDQPPRACATFRLRMTCCGHYESVWPVHGPGLTWAVADQIRNDYVASMPDHDRVAIIEPFAPATEHPNADEEPHHDDD